MTSEPITFAHAAIELPAEGTERDNFITAMRGERSHLIALYKQAVASADGEGIMKARHQLLTSFPAKFCAALDVRKKTGTKKNYSIEECFHAALSVNVFSPIKELVTAYCVEKSGGKAHRLIFDFGLTFRTAHRMVERVLEPYFTPRPFQFTNKGVDRAIKQARSLVAGPKTWVAVIDIESYYNSFELDLLKHELPLPSAVADCAVSGRHIETVWKGYAEKLPLHYRKSLVDPTRRALPTGASTSSMIAQMICSRLNIPTSVADSLVNYGDDFWLTGETEAEATAKADALIAAIAKLPGGVFTARRRICRIFEGPQYLGYQFSWSEGKLAISPSEKNWDRLHERLVSIHFKETERIGSFWIPSKKFVVRLVAKQLACISSFHSAFSAATHLDQDTLKSLMVTLESDLDAVGASWADVKKIKVAPRYTEWENPSEFG
ncbi:hypothetical protein [Pelagibacterium mangrovi]|uniref:hypothetical protein n=1 Tax=Pelagibacterium mangrovi TaxID=3119828 RepID=UPI002FC785F1